MHRYVSAITKIFRQHADPLQANGAKAYMRGQFEFLGLKAALRQELSKTYMKTNLPHAADLEIIVKELWDLPEREYQYFAIDLLAAMRKYWKKEIITLFEFMLINKSWWDTVDHAASDLLGPYFKLFPESIKPVTDAWNQSDNFWLQRSSIMFQKKYKKDTDTALLATYILRHTRSKEFFIQKAIGWALREYSKTDPAWVIKFVASHQLAPLSQREALKRIG
ncbi:MAG: DNA alkylation repair protein [Ferruginibacter sp.]